ncbi:MAG: hypothetical protein R6U04_03410 [Bacteroidales bacterium]
MALINSKLINWYYTLQFTNESNLTVNLSKTYLSQIPINTKPDKTEDFIIDKVDQILQQKQQDPTTDTIALEAEIDRMVYDLYGLTEEEVRIVEGSV